MDMKAILPMIDLVFLTLGALLGVMTQMERVTALEIEITRVGKGAAVVQTGEFMILTLSDKDQLTLNGEAVIPKTLQNRVGGQEIIFRVHKNVAAHRVFTLLNDLTLAGATVKLEVEEQLTSVPEGSTNP